MEPTQHRPSSRAPLSWRVLLCCCGDRSTIELYVLCCPPEGNVPVSCAVTITNDGPVGLSAFTLAGGKPAEYTSLTCGDTGILAVGATRACTLTRTVSQVGMTKGVGWSGAITARLWGTSEQA